MKKSFILWIAMLTTCMASAQVSTWDGTCEPWTHGTGTEADPFLIENAQQLANLFYRVNNGLDAGGGHVSNHDLHYKLMVDVDLNGSEDFQWTPIGYWNSDTDYQCFGGYFDGNNHVITNLYINSEADRVGLFGFVDGATIMQVHIDSGNISTTSKHAGGIIGASIGTSNIIYCSNNTAVFSNENTGGIIGIISHTTNSTVRVLNCQNSGNISSGGSGYCSTGGIIGDNYQCSNSVVENCLNIGDITSSGSGNWRYVGGIVALNHYSHISITNCYNTGNITNSGIGYNRYASGILGANNTYDAEVKYTYNVGDIVIDGGSGCASGIGCVQSGSINITNSYYLNTCGGNNTYGGVAMTSTQMRDPQFVTTLNQGQATPVWESDYANPINDGYPILEWQLSGVGINENGIGDCTISPNPTNGKVIIEAKDLKHVSINNLLGQTMYDGNASGNEFTYDFSKHKTGIYLICIETTSGVVVKKVSVTR